MATLDDVLLTVVIIAGVIFVPWVFLIRPWLRRRAAPAAHAPEAVDLTTRRPPSGWSIRGELARLFLVADDMSRDRGQASAGAAGVDQVRHPAPGLVSVSAAPNTDDTEQVPGVAGVSDIDTDPRAIVRASLIAELLDSGLLSNRDRAIMVAFHCSKASSSRPDSTFQKALRLVEQHRTKRTPEYISDLRARVDREVAEQH